MVLPFRLLERINKFFMQTTVVVRIVPQNNPETLTKAGRTMDDATDNRMENGLGGSKGCGTNNTIGGATNRATENGVDDTIGSTAGDPIQGMSDNAPGSVGDDDAPENGGDYTPRTWRTTRCRTRGATAMAETW